MSLFLFPVCSLSPKRSTKSPGDFLYQPLTHRIVSLMKFSVMKVIKNTMIFKLTHKKVHSLSVLIAEVRIDGAIWRRLPPKCHLDCLVCGCGGGGFCTSARSKSPTKSLSDQGFISFMGPGRKEIVLLTQRADPFRSPPSPLRLRCRCVLGSLAFAVNTWRNLINRGAECLITFYEFPVHPVLHILKVLWF